MDTIEYATFRYDTAEVENGLYALHRGLVLSQKTYREDPTKSRTSNFEVSTHNYQRSLILLLVVSENLTIFHSKCGQNRSATLIE